jgi:hypothetical protein
MEASEGRERAHKQQIKQREASLAAMKKKAEDLRELVAGLLGQEETTRDGTTARQPEGNSMDPAKLERVAAAAETRVRELRAQVTQAETAAEVPYSHSCVWVSSSCRICQAISQVSIYNTVNRAQL